MNEDAIREAQLYRHLETFDSPDANELQVRVDELEELCASLSVYLEELFDIALGKDVVTPIQQLIHDIKNDGLTIKTLRSVRNGIYSKTLEEILK